MAQDEPARPVPEPFQAAPRARRLTLTSRDDPWRYELADAGATYSVLTGRGNPVRAITATGEWTFAVHQRRWSWWGVSVRTGSGRADAAFYPSALPGGQIATDDRAYTLRHEPLRWDWRLRDDAGRTLLVASHVGTRWRSTRVVKMDMETTPDFAGVADPAWLLSLTSWIVVIHGSAID
jgi:hypothetical protein